MKDYVIVSDATLDLPNDIINKMNIKVVPMGMDIDGVEYVHYPDERELTIEEFYGKLKAGAVPHTTQITPAIFFKHFGEILDKGQDILYIAFSSGLSGTFNTSQIVIEELKEKYPERTICSVDSLCASIGEGLLVYHAALKKEEGFSLEQLKLWVEENKRSPQHWFTVKDLFYLKRGGRITALEAAVGTALKIRPVLSTNEEGKLTVVSKIRGSKAEMEFLVAKLEREGTKAADQTVLIGHGDDLDQALALKKIIEERNLVKEVLITNIGPIIGSHTGPGMLALSYLA